MAWRAPTTDDLVATLSLDEVNAFNQSAATGSTVPASDDLVARTAALVRSYIRRNHAVRLGPAGTLPEGLISPAMDYAAFDVLKRLPVEVGSARVKAREQALLLFEDVAANKVTPESCDEEEDDSVESAFPDFPRHPRTNILNGSVLSVPGTCVCK